MRTLRLGEGNLLQSHNRIFAEQWSTSPLFYAKSCLKYGKETSKQALDRTSTGIWGTSILTTVFQNHREEHQFYWVEKWGLGDTLWISCWTSVNPQLALSPRLCLAPKLLASGVTCIAAVNRLLPGIPGSTPEWSCLFLQSIPSELLIKLLNARLRRVSPYTSFRDFFLPGVPTPNP